MQAEADHAEPLRLAALYAAWATYSPPKGKRKHRAGILFKTPHKLDMHHLVPAEEVDGNGLVQLQFSSHHWRHREGFQLTDAGTDLTGALDQTHYCIKCHNQVAKTAARQDFKEKDGTFQSQRLRRETRGLPPRRENLRDERRERKRQSDRRISGRHRR